jgi:protocatechuate 3,4-dioxygenase, beta subunit
MRYKIIIALLAAAIALPACSQPKPVSVDACEDCDMMFAGMPTLLAKETKLNDASEPGEPMVITGTIFKSDGRTAAPNIILYVYHTDNTGEYTPSQGQRDARRHGHLRGWIKTDASGQYKISSIRPAPYPGRQAPAHIHPIVQEPDGRFYWIDEYLFEDDPLVTAEVRKNERKRGGNGIIALKKVNGVWEGKRDIVLGQNIPNY